MTRRPGLIVAAPETVPDADERLGQTTAERPEGVLLWTHAADGPDAAGAAALSQELARIRAQPVWLLVTTEGAAPLPPHLSDVAIHQLAPSESRGSIARFLGQWRPDAGLFLGPPRRPQLIAAAADAGIPLYLASANRDGAPTSGRRPARPDAIYDRFEMCLAGSAAEGTALEAKVGDASKVSVTGPLLDTGFALTCNEAERDTLARLLGARPSWLAAGATDAEISAIETAHRRAMRSAHRLLLILVPRRPEDGPTIAEGMGAQGWRVALRSAEEEPLDDVQVYVADTEGELGLWYRLAPVTFIGGSFDPEAEPTDPFEPAALGSSVVHGPHVASNPRFSRLALAGAALRVTEAEALGDTVSELLQPDRAAALAHAGWRAISESAHAIEKLAVLIDEALDRRDAG